MMNSNQQEGVMETMVMYSTLTGQPIKEGANMRPTAIHHWYCKDFAGAACLQKAKNLAQDAIAKAGVR